MLKELFQKLKKDHVMEEPVMENISLTEVSEIPVTKGLDILVLADTHGVIINDLLRNKIKTEPDLIIILGDLYYQNLESFFAVYDAMYPTSSVKILGVLGNHDDKDLFSFFPRIINMDGKEEDFIIKGTKISIAGLAGSIRYKYSDHYVLRTHKESEEILDPLPKADLLITHDKPCFEKPEGSEYDYLCTDAHAGLYGIGKYIMEKKPQLVLHGHTHKPSKNRYEDSYIRCCYRIERFKI